MDLTISIIFVFLTLLVISAWRLESYLKKISESNDLIIRCLDAHEAILRKTLEESDRQGSDIESIKDYISSR